MIARFRPEAVVHLAAIAVPFSRSEPTTFRVNTQLAFNICATSVALGVEKLIVASNPTVIGYGAPGGWTPAYLPLDEDHPTEPWNAYNLSKVVAEQTMRTFARTTETTRMAAVRPCFVVAPEEWEGAPTQSGHTIGERLNRPEIGGVSLFNYLDARDAGDFVDTLLTRLPLLETNGEVLRGRRRRPGARAAGRAAADRDAGDEGVRRPADRYRPRLLLRQGRAAARLDRQAQLAHRTLLRKPRS